ncbi:MAG: imidazolonepropionase [Saprospiraceae bacterium]
MTKRKLIGPFRQLLTMANLPDRGPLKDEQLEIIPEAGILIENEKIIAVGSFKVLKQKHPKVSKEIIREDMVALPGWIDAHTHICFAGSRAKDYAARNNGKSYLEIAKAGGGIRSTVLHTRAAEASKLFDLTMQRLDRHLKNGVTTVEIKSGYGLGVEEELKQLRVIKQADQKHAADVVSTCLAAHIIPNEFKDATSYLAQVQAELVPRILNEKLTHRFDIFIEDTAFTPEIAKPYLSFLREKGFQLTVHGDQFSRGGSQVAIDCGAVSVDHLEASGEQEIKALAQSKTIPVALPGASIGLGCSFAPARKLLDAGCALAIASDWNPGSAPQGNLLAQAAILGAFEQLSAAEVFAGLSFRAAQALQLFDRGTLVSGKMADIIAFPTEHFSEILYHQGMLKVKKVWKKGQIVE